MVSRHDIFETFTLQILRKLVITFKRSPRDTAKPILGSKQPKLEEQLWLPFRYPTKYKRYRVDFTGVRLKKIECCV